jgi:hypothetical protein
MNPQEKTFRNQLFMAVAAVILTTILSGVGIIMKTSYQTEELKAEVKDKLSSEFFGLYMKNQQEMNKALQDKDAENTKDIKEINAKMEEMIKQFYITRGKSIAKTTQETEDLISKRGTR